MIDAVYCLKMITAWPLSELCCLTRDIQSIGQHMIWWCQQQAKKKIQDNSKSPQYFIPYFASPSLLSKKVAKSCLVSIGGHHVHSTLPFDIFDSRYCLALASISSLSSRSWWCDQVNIKYLCLIQRFSYFFRPGFACAQNCSSVSSTMIGFLC